MHVTAGIDIGGTRVKSVLLDESLVVRSTVTTATPKDLARVGVVGAVRAAVASLLSAAPDLGEPLTLTACGLAVPGIVDDVEGVGVYSANLGWRDLPLRDPVAEALGVPAVVGHDVRAGLLAEMRLGAGAGARHALFLAAGTGVAAGLMVDGHVLRADGWAGEVGHLAIEAGGPRCGCGGDGCLEAVASASAIARAYTGRTGLSLTAEQVAGLVARNEPDAVAVWSRAVTALGRAIDAVAMITGVDLVIIGGGLANSDETLLAPLRADLGTRARLRPPPTVKRALLGERAGSIGAALLAVAAP